MQRLLDDGALKSPQHAVRAAIDQASNCAIDAKLNL